MADKMGVIELNENLLNRMPDSLYNLACVQGFYCKSISFKKGYKYVWAYVNCWKYLWWCGKNLSWKTTQVEANHNGIIRTKRGESASSNTLPAKDGSYGKRRKLYVDCSENALKTCMIHGDGHSSGECKFLGKFGTKYAAAQPVKVGVIDPIPSKTFH